MNNIILILIAFLLYISLLTQCTKQCDPELKMINIQLERLNRSINAIEHDVDILNDKATYK